MIVSRYKCNSCHCITEFDRKGNYDVFPVAIMCSHCHSHDTRRLWEPIQYNVKRQQCGNAKNGYTSVSNMHDESKS